MIEVLVEVSFTVLSGTSLTTTPPTIRLRTGKGPVHKACIRHKNPACKFFGDEGGQCA